MPNHFWAGILIGFLVGILLLGAMCQLNIAQGMCSPPTQTFFGEIP